MKQIIVFMGYVMDCLKSVTSFILSIPGLILSGLSSLATAFVVTVQNVAGVVDRIVDFFSTAQDLLHDAMTTISSMQYWNLFYHAFALDKLAYSFTTFLTIAIILIILAAFEMLFHAIVIAVPFLIYKSTCKMVQAISAGFAKVG